MTNHVNVLHELLNYSRKPQKSRLRASTKLSTDIIALAIMPPVKAQWSMIESATRLAVWSHLHFEEVLT